MGGSNSANKGKEKAIQVQNDSKNAIEETRKIYAEKEKKMEK